MSDLDECVAAARAAAERGDAMAAVEAAERAFLQAGFVELDASQRCEIFEALGTFWLRCFGANVVARVAKLSSHAPATAFTEAAEAVSASGRPGIAAALWMTGASLDPKADSRLAAARALEEADAPDVGLEFLAKTGGGAQDFAVAATHARLALLARRVALAETLVSPLTPQNEAQRVVYDELQGALWRALTLQGTPFAGETSLRGWHMVMTGGLLLRVADQRHGDGAFHGRFGRHQDGPSVALEAVRKIAYVMGVFDVSVPDVYFHPDWPSAVLGHAIGKVFGKMPKPLALPCSEPGLIVVNNLESLPATEQAMLAQKRPGQILWNHVCRHNVDHSLAGDFTTFLCAVNTTPWAVGPDGAPPMNAASPFDLAEGVSTATLYDDALADVPSLINLCRRVANSPEQAGPGFLLEAGQRPPQRRASPVTRRAGR